MSVDCGVLTVVEATPCRDEVNSNISRLYGANTIDLPICDRIFDLNSDGKINIADAVIFGMMTEAECYTLMTKYNSCLLNPPRTPPCGNYGDIDNDGFVTQVDAQMVADYTVGNIILTEEQLKRADVNGDGEISMIDAVIIGKYAAGTYDTFPICTMSSANITAIDITITPTSCIEPCDSIVSITWQNTGQIGSYFVPRIYQNGTLVAEWPEVLLQGDETVTYEITLPTLYVGTYTICPEPN